MHWSRKLFLSVLCVVSAVVAPGFVELGAYKALDALPPVGTVSPSPSVSPTPAEAPAPTDRPSPDETRTVTVQTDAGIRTLTMHDYLRGVLAGEMPSSFSTEALRAQAVCARTYACYEAQRDKDAHPEADVCDSFRCCQVWLDDETLRQQWGNSYAKIMTKLDDAVSDTDGQILLWEDEPALACFHASSAGKTEDCAALWGEEIPYLVSVDSPETAASVPNYVTEVLFSSEEFSSILCAAQPEASLAGAPESWIGDVICDASGRVDTVTVGGVHLTGAELRQLFSLRSAAFTVDCTDGAFRFTVTGSGHGVGMSQYGAEVMAEAGSTYAEILAHYYPGTVLAG